MTEALELSVDSSLSETANLKTLTARISRMCQVARFAALGYALWVLFEITRFWTNVDAVNRGYGRYLHVDLSELNFWQLALVYGLNLLVWAVAAYACYSAWQLFSNYREGKIFSTESAIWLRRIAFFGLIAVICGIALRPLASMILTSHLPAGQGIVNLSFQPDDLLNLLLLGGLLALSHIQKSAAEIAGENAQFV